MSFVSTLMLLNLASPIPVKRQAPNQCLVPLLSCVRLAQGWERFSAVYLQALQQSPLTLWLRQCLIWETFQSCSWLCDIRILKLKQLQPKQARTVVALAPVCCSLSVMAAAGPSEFEVCCLRSCSDTGALPTGLALLKAEPAT